MNTDLIKKNLKEVLVVSGSGLLFPILLSYPLAVLFNTSEYSQTSIGVLGLFVGVVMAISALPVLARILVERRLLATNLGVRLLHFPYYLFILFFFNFFYFWFFSPLSSIN